MISPNLWMFPVSRDPLEGGSLFVFQERPARPARRRLSLLVSALALAVAACGGAADEGTSGDTDGGAAAEPTTTTQAAGGSTASPTTTPPAVTAEMEDEPTTTTRADVRLGWGEVAVIDGEPVTFDEVAELAPSIGDVVDPQLFAESLLLLITNRVWAAAAEEEFGLVITDAAVEAKKEELVALTGLPEDELFDAYGLTAVALRAISTRELFRESVISALAAGMPAPTEEELRARYEVLLLDASQACSAHILLETEEEAEAALERALAGEEFAALAMELSTGPSGPNGGDLGCGPPSQYVEEFAAGVLDSEVGVAYGPVETQFGWHVILVSERTVPDFEEMREAVVAEAQNESAGPLWEEWALGAMAAADVQVEPEYGVWTTDPFPNVIPPSP